MAFSPALSYLDITNSTATNHSYATLQLLDHPRLGSGVTDDDEEQLRVFKNGIELQRPGVTGLTPGYTVNETTKQVVLAAALVTTDRLIILRQTRQDRPYVEFTGGAPFNRKPDYNLAVDQMMLLIQEIQEQPQVIAIIGGAEPPNIANKEKYQVVVTGSTAAVHSYSAITLIRNDRVRHEDQLVVEKNGVVLALTTDYTVQPAAQTITLVVALTAPDTLKITRQTKRTRLVPSIPDGSSPSSDILLTQAQQVEHLVEELPYFIGYDDNKILSGIRHPRRKNFVRYSGPGDTFYYGNLPYLQNSQVFVWRDEVLLTDGTDYTNNDWAWLIDLINSLLAGEVLTIMTVPICTWPELWFCDWSDLGPIGDDGAPTGPSQPVPTVLVPSTQDFTNLTADGAATLVCDGSPLTESIRIHWDLSAFVGRAATAATFGIYQVSGMEATDSVKVFEANEDWDKVNPSTPVLTWDVSATKDGLWAVTPSVLTFVNQRLEDDGHVRVILEPATAGTEFTVRAKEGQTNMTFGPHMSLNNAPYLVPAGGVVSKIVAPFTATASATDRQVIVVNPDGTKHFGWLSGSFSPSGNDFHPAIGFGYFCIPRAALGPATGQTFKVDMDDEADPNLYVRWAFDHGVGETANDVVYSPISNLVFVGGTQSTTWTGSGGANANVWALDPNTGVVVWSKLLGTVGLGHSVSFLDIDASGNLFASLSISGGGLPSGHKLDPITGNILASGPINTGFNRIRVNRTTGKVLGVGTGGDVKIFSNSLILENSFVTGGVAESTGDWIGSDVIVFNSSTLNEVGRYTVAGATVWGSPFRIGDDHTGVVLNTGSILIVGNRNTLWTGSGGAPANVWRLNGATGVLELSADNTTVPDSDPINNNGRRVFTSS